MWPVDRRAAAGLHRTIPALPVRDVLAAVAYYRERFGGTREFATLDTDGDLLTFFRWNAS